MKIVFKTMFIVAIITIMGVTVGETAGGEPKLIDAVTGIELVSVKGGCFQMGDTFGDGESDEKPVHEVCVSNFYIGKYEVTRGQWKKVMGRYPSYPSYNDEPPFCGDDCPVVWVSWNDIQDFIRKLNFQSGKNYRLPTEAEWEYAARSGGKKEKFAGTSNESELGDYAWYGDRGVSESHPVGQKKPNGLGIYDMTGNVWEWCSDWYGEKYYGESENPKGPFSGFEHVIRGGDWGNDARTSRAAIRNRIGPTTWSVGVGFRVASQAGEEILEEILIGSEKFIIRVGSNGCTDKNSFNIDVKKRDGISSKTPHYNLTVLRIKPDECKAVVASGALVLFDLKKDLGINGIFSYSITNRVLSSSIVPPADESLMSIIEKHFAFNFLEIKVIRPEPYAVFVMDHDYFTCLIPGRWELKRDKEGSEKAGIFEIKLTKPDKAKPEDGEKYFSPDPLIYVGYYAKNNNQNKTYEDFMKDYDYLMQKNEGSKKSRYEKSQSIKLNGREAVVHAYEVYQEVPRGPLFEAKYWLKARFIILKAKDGFYVLVYKSPKEFYDMYLPVFEEVVKSFKSPD